jgi:lysine-specific demethylase/histidyl-hydroxylase NO66
MSLAALIAPMTVETFAEEVWGKRSHHFAGAPDRFAGMIGSADVDRILRFVKPKPPQQILVVQGSRHYPVNWVNPDGSPRSEMVRKAWLDGYSIVLNDVGSYWEPVTRFCAELQRGIHHPVDANLYLTPPGTQGFDPHFDIMDVFILQLEGTKEWSIWDSVRDSPLADQHSAIDSATLGEPLWQGEIGPGEMLYIPRGHAHAARATSEASVHLSVGVAVWTWLDLMLASADAARRDRRFREALPPGFFDRPANLETGMAERLALLPEHMTLEAGLAGIAKNLLENAPLPREDLLEVAPKITLDARLERRPGVLCSTAGDDTMCVLRYSGGQLAAPGRIASAIAFVAEHEQWSPDELPGQLGDRERIVLAERLLREGVVQRATVS